MPTASVTPEQQSQLARYRDLLLERSSRMNLTAIRDTEGVDQRLIAESLKLLPFLDDSCAADSEVVDIGTGAGIPGIPLAIVRPDITWTLIDGTAKKVAFLREVIEALPLHNVVLYHGRVEELAHEGHLRGRYHCLTARAVASLPALLELGVPMIRTGGTLLLPKGPEIAEELDDAGRAASELGAQIVSSDWLQDTGTGIDTRLVIVAKERDTPVQYPRRAGLPARSPLGSQARSAATG
ncbi:16S rRNA (guanine(527)-N(7))-methyltransferase RsmG [soil metagenome]